MLVVICKHVAKCIPLAGHKMKSLQRIMVYDCSVPPRPVPIVNQNGLSGNLVIAFVTFITFFRLMFHHILDLLALSRDH